MTTTQTQTHTPGPWNVAAWNSCELRYVPHRWRSIGPAYGYAVATCSPKCARLIAAAPELNDSLGYFAGYTESIPEGAHDSDEITLTVTVGSLREARAAIAKATQTE